jgi:signal transduction histidine kinase
MLKDLILSEPVHGPAPAALRRHSGRRVSGAPAFGLRTHFLIFSLLMVVTILTSGVLFSLRVQDDKMLENTVQQDLHLLTAAPRLRSEIHQIDLLSEMNAEINDPAWLARRERRLNRLKDVALELAPGPYTAKVNGLLAQLQNELPLFLLDQEKNIDAATLEKRRPVDLERAADVAARKGIFETLNAVSTEVTLELGQAIDKTHKTAIHRILGRLAVELFAAMMIAFYLYYFMVMPILEIEKAANEWKVGQPWNPRPRRAIPEIRSLLSIFSKSTADVNAQFRKEHELNEFKTKLVSLVSHEFGNGLAVILNAAFLLEESSSPQDFETKKGFVKMITLCAKTLNQEVLNLLNMSRLEAGKLAVNFKKTPVDEILQGVVNRLAPLAQRKGLEIRLDLATGLLPVNADASTLTLAISNLMTNAIKYTRDNGSINIGIQKEPGRPEVYRIYVQDTGIGISEEDRAKIFSGYFRTESGRKMTPKGFGIGLSLVKQIIEAHGSSLELESSPGKGSRFSFLLPLWRA